MVRNVLNAGPLPCVAILLVIEMDARVEVRAAAVVIFRVVCAFISVNSSLRLKNLKKLKRVSFLSIMKIFPLT